MYLRYLPMYICLVKCPFRLPQPYCLHPLVTVQYRSGRGPGACRLACSELHFSLLPKQLVISSADLGSSVPRAVGLYMYI